MFKLGLCSCTQVQDENIQAYAVLMLGCSQNLGFVQNDGSDIWKVNKPVVFPLDLDITQLCSHELVARKGGRFALSGVIVHEGYTQQVGHYWGVHKWPSGKWVMHNDSTVRAVSEQEVLSLQTEAFLLVYDAAEEYARNM